MRKLIAGFKTSVDAKIEGPEGFADWVDTWTDDYGLMPQIDACLFGEGMCPGYDQNWTVVQGEPGKPVWITVGAERLAFTAARPIPRSRGSAAVATEDASWTVARC